MKISREIFFYLLFGGLTTIVNIVAFYLFTRFSLSTAVSTVLAWIISVIFAFFTNKIFVFKSNNKNYLKEMVAFFGCRLFSGIVDLVIMVVFVDLLHFNSIVIKILSNVVVVILNYFFSKFFIFKTKN